MSIVNVPHDIFGLFMLKLNYSIESDDIMDYYKQLLCVKLSCKTFFEYLKNITFFSITKHYFQETNIIFFNYSNFTDLGFSYQLCGNPNCYDDTEDYYTEREYPNTRYIHSHQFRAPCSHYCTYCKMSFIVDAHF